MRQQRDTYRLYDAGGDLTKRWFIHWKGPDGKRVKDYAGLARHKTAEARRAAAAAYIQRLKAREAPPPVQEADLITILRAGLDARRDSLRAVTVRQYARVLQRIAAWAAAHPGDTDTIARSYIASIPARTTAQEHAVRLSAMWSAARPEEPSPFRRLRGGRIERTPAMYFTPEEARRLSEQIHARHPQLGLMCMLMYYCFIRPSEAIRLRVGDVLLGEGKIRVRAAAAKNRRTAHVVIPDAFRTYLQAMDLAQYDAGYCLIARGGRPGPHGLTNTQRMHDQHRAIMLEGGFTHDRYTLYSWKHTGVAAAAKAGVSMKTLQLQLRHHSLDQVNAYMRRLGLDDFTDLAGRFPGI